MPNAPRYAVIDIGSNSVRMVVYERGRMALPLFNEKASCCLGKDLAKTGQLNPKGLIEAKLLLQRFAHLAKNMRVKRITAVATAALRTAKNGKKFVSDIHKKTGLRIAIIPGTEEAKLSAIGTLAAFPDADGVMGDMGGGSMELVAINSGRIGKKISLQHGPLNLMNLQLNAALLQKKIYADLSDHKWLPAAGRGKTFYAVGGVFRAMARLHMEITKYPLHVVHNYRVDRAAFIRFLRAVRQNKWKKLAAKSGIAKTRIAAMPFAAAVLLELFQKVKFDNVCFSTYGLREGVAFYKDKKYIAGQDLLLSTCRGLAQRSNRFALNGDEVFEFLNPIVKTLPVNQKRLFHAACWLSDIGWADHPEERAKQIFHRLLYAPLLALDHDGRVFIAVCCYSRYAGKFDKLPDVVHLLDQKTLQLAMRLGLALRFADTLCGGVSGILPKLDFALRGKNIVLKLPKFMQVAGGEEVSKRLDAMADAYKLQSLIVQKS